jgi:hypothetical protein
MWIKEFIDTREDNEADSELDMWEHVLSKETVYLFVTCRAYCSEGLNSFPQI